MEIALVAVLMILNVLNVFLHSTGCYLLVCIAKQNDDQRIQLMFLIHLSICEALMNLLEGLRRIPEFLTLSPRNQRLNDDLQRYIQIAMFAGISIVYYLDMIYLTLNRLLDILLNIRYHLYITHGKVKYLLFATWIFAGGLTIIISCMVRYTDYNWEENIFVYCFPILNFGFIIISLITYGFIFQAYRRTRKTPSCKGKPRQSVYQVFRNSRFYVSVLLILTFLLFIVVPDLTYLFVAVVNGNETNILLAACWISYAIGNLSDCYIYIFMQKKVRKLLIKKLMKAMGRRVVAPKTHVFTMKSLASRTQGT